MDDISAKIECVGFGQKIYDAQEVLSRIKEGLVVSKEDKRSIKEIYDLFMSASKAATRLQYAQNGKNPVFNEVTYDRLKTFEKIMPAFLDQIVDENITDFFESLAIIARDYYISSEVDSKRAQKLENALKQLSQYNSF